MSKKTLNEFELPTPPPAGGQNLIPPGETDHEGAMAKADLYKLANYSVKLFKKLDDNAQLESWVQAKITKAADYIASVYHYLEYEMDFSKYGHKLENSEMMNEEKKAELHQKLIEAKEIIKALKIAQAQKIEEAKSPKAKKDWDKDGKIESEKDEVIGSRRKAAGLDESQDDDDEDDDSGYDKDDPKHPTWAERQRNKADLARKEKKEKDISESWDDDDEDPDVKKADSELKKRGVKLPKTKADPDKDMSKLAKKSKKEDDLDESWDDDDEDPDVKKADSELKKRGVKLPNVKHKEVPIKKTSKDKEEELDEGSGPYQLSDPKHPKFKANYEKFKKANPDKKLSDFVDAMRKKDKVGGLDEGKGKKPDFLDLDKDGNKKEPMKKAAKEKKLDELSHATLKSYADKKGDQMFKDKKPASGKDLTNYRKAIDKMHKKEDEGDVSESYKDRDMRKEPDLSPALRVHGGGHGAIDNDSKSRDYANSWLDDDDAVRGMKELEKVSKKKESKKESMNESAELARMKEFLTRLNG